MPNECIYNQDEICVNVNCPLWGDFCHVRYIPDVCKWEDRSDNNEQFSKPD